MNIHIYIYIYIYVYIEMIDLEIRREMFFIWLSYSLIKHEAVANASRDHFLTFDTALTTVQFEMV